MSVFSPRPIVVRCSRTLGSLPLALSWGCIGGRTLRRITPPPPSLRTRTQHLPAWPNRRELRTPQAPPGLPHRPARAKMRTDDGLHPWASPAYFTPWSEAAWPGTDLSRFSPSPLVHGMTSVPPCGCRPFTRLFLPPVGPCPFWLDPARPDVARPVLCVGCFLLVFTGFSGQALRATMNRLPALRGLYLLHFLSLTSVRISW